MVPVERDIRKIEAAKRRIGTPCVVNEKDPRFFDGIRDLS
jgi:hypothetical protein